MHLSNDEKFIRRFKREALSVSNLSHPNIVEVYDVGEEDGNYYIVMEYIERKDIKTITSKKRSLNPNRSNRYNESVNRWFSSRS